MASRPYLKKQDASAAFEKQVRAILASKRRDAGTIARDRAAYTTTSSSCLTATQGFTGTATTGLVAADADEVLVNTVRIKGYHELPAGLDVNTDGIRDTHVRLLLVWFYKPLLVASAAGTLPPITEVLEADEIEAFPVTAAANGGRFVIISDETWNLGCNVYQAITNPAGMINTGRSKQYFDYTVEVDKKLKFKSDATDAAAGGHYDSVVSAGQVSRGLLVLYCQPSMGCDESLNLQLNTRLNYTG